MFNYIKANFVSIVGNLQIKTLC